ncbi:hypothetical protein BO70DRAFT_418029 [Aspergillus heteromorphus CBS 117.55]|uniref:Zn(2)-C6 fungal-type domain-containing protein n=1 Tax=Aspergillus heteromorphus CBS 117.55 TaxID=1448321 RepID=A0A317WTE8_9EURO|nr:uncharacterized protein BO70DRAFT_418029 [Aspergillus heteromorphus CBS 117.55]PWY89071.1 hypothetical protein BO70DRAFT_418029 [Aspergillus heteromorphus CBS 117.55]
MNPSPKSQSHPQSHSHHHPQPHPPPSPKAKIRCSHEKPSCRRCQKHNIECIYSISRRLGRPAKKKDGCSSPSATPAGTAARGGGLGGTLDHDPLDLERCFGPQQQQQQQGAQRGMMRGGQKKKNKVKEDGGMGMGMGLGLGMDMGIGMGIGVGVGMGMGMEVQMGLQEVDALGHRGHGLDDTLMLENMAGVEMDPVSLEGGSSVQTDCFMDGGLFSVSDGIDLSTDSWLHEFMTNPAADLAQERELLDSLGLSSIKPESSCVENSPETKGFVTETQDEGYLAPTTFEHQQQQQQQQQSDVPDQKYLKEDLLAWPQPVENFPRPVSITDSTPAKVSKRGCGYALPPTGGEITPTPAMLQYQCQCHERTSRELIRVNIFASRAGPYATIDSILSCQRVLQQLSETILQCTVCCRTRANLLMVVIVGIDSLVTALEAITSVDSGLADRLFAGYHHHDQLLPDRRYRGPGLQFRSQVEACPLVVGGFCVPTEDKFCFIKHVLWLRLSEMLATVRKIRVCTQEISPVSASRGKLIMMMETDRRLELIMMRTKMLARP